MKNRALLLFLFLFSSFANADSIKIEDLELKRAIGMIYE